MQIHEITKLTEQSPSTLGGMVGSSIMGGLARMVGGGQQESPEKIAAANQARISNVAQKAWPRWVARKAQLQQTLGTRVNYGQELLNWLETVVMSNTSGLNMREVDPTYGKAIGQQIAKMIQIPDTDSENLQKEFEKLVGLAVMARPDRKNKQAVAKATAANPTAKATGGTIPISTQGGQVSIGRYRLDQNKTPDQFVLAYLQDLIQQEKI